MNLRDMSKRSVSVGFPMQFAALLVTLAWLTHGRVLVAQSVIPMTWPWPSVVISDAMPAMDSQACPVCLRAPVPALLLLEFRNPDPEGISQRPFANSGAWVQPCLAHLDQISDWGTLPIQIRFCRWRK